MPDLGEHSSKCKDALKPVLFLLSSLRLYDSIPPYHTTYLTISCSAGSQGEPPESVRSCQGKTQDHRSEVHEEKTPIASKQRCDIISSLCPTPLHLLILATCLNLTVLWKKSQQLNNLVS